MTSAVPRPKLKLRTVMVLCAGLLAVGLIAENLSWLSPLKIAIQRTPSQFPSTLTVPSDELARPGSVLSVYTEDRYFRDPGYGLLNHRQKRGRDWEHPAVMSYFEDGALKFASPVGLRLHGGVGRKVGESSISVRLYLRRYYDSGQFSPSVIFGGKRNPMRLLIIHNARSRISRDGIRSDWYLSNALAYDIVRRTGALAPETHPVSFVLNGRPRGLYELTEPVRRMFLQSRFGHDNFERADLGYRRPAQPDDFSLPDPWRRPSFKEALEDLKSRTAPFTLADASRWIDVESLTRWFVSVVFCATTNPFQAAILRDKTNPDSLWFWVGWDMDHSFMDVYGAAPTPWLHDTFRMTLQNDDIESYLIGRLLAEDPAYRDYLVLEFLNALNYRLTPAFLDERYHHYRTIIERFGLERSAPDPSITRVYHYHRAVAERFELGGKPNLETLANFLKFRSAHVREQLVRELNLAPLRQVRIEGPGGTAFRIDGHAVTAGFSGWYISGTDIHVEVEGQPANFSHWTVDSKRMPSPELRQQVEENIVIEAKFRT